MCKFALFEDDRGRFAIRRFLRLAQSPAVKHSLTSSTPIFGNRVGVSFLFVGIIIHFESKYLIFLLNIKIEFVLLLKIKN